ncbi:MAG: hypothetical protein R3F30_11000 [Planctomycetota bacterium]
MESTGGMQDETGAMPGQAQGTLEAQRRNLLIQQYKTQAQNLMADLRYEDAKATLLRAFEIDQDDPDLRKLYNEVLRQLGERQGDLTSYRDYMIQLQQVRIQKEKADVRRLIGEARDAREKEDFDKAIDLLKKVEIRLEVGANIDWEGLDGEARNLLASYRGERDQALREQQEREEHAAWLRLREQQREAEERVNRQVNDLLAKGTRSFETRQFDKAVEYAEEALRLQPLNEVARQLQNAADKALRDVVKDRYLAEKTREFNLYLTELQEQKTPYTDVLTGPSADYWLKISALRSDSAEGKAVMKDETTLALEALLRTTQLPAGMSFEDGTSYIEVIDQVNSTTGVNVLVSPEARQSIEDNGYSITPALTLNSALPLRNFLNILVDRTSRELAYMIREGTIILTTRQKSLGKPVLRVHPIKDLTAQITNFTGPIIRDIPRPGGDEEGEPRAGGEEEDPVTFVDPSQLDELVRKHVAPTSWDAEGVQMEATETNLIVQHTPEVQEQIAVFLDDLRKFSTSLVSIESKFLRVNRNFLEEIGVDWRGLGGANAKGTEAQLDDISNGPPDNASRGLDNNGTQSPSASPVAGFFYDDGLDGDFRGRTENYFSSALGEILTTRGGGTLGLTLLDDTEFNLLLRAVTKSQDVQVVDSQLLTVLNGQRANVSVIEQTAFVQDFSVEVAQAAFIADPEVNVIQDGVVLDVQPTISYDRKYITLELQPTVAELVRPIPTFTTSLSGTTLPVTIQFPQMTVSSTGTSVKVPDGGTVLIGGLNRVLNRERRAEVPWLADLPLISFLFKQEGVVDENRSLMVMVKASIFNVREVMKQREAQWARWNLGTLGTR